MKKLMLVPALLLVACGDNIHPDEDQVEINSEEDGGGHDDDAPPTFQAGIQIMTETCTRTVAHFEAIDLPSTNVACKWTFDDGATSTECTGSHEFATAGSHDFVLEVTDLDTGATSRATQTRIFQPIFTIWLDVESHDLSIAYIGTSPTGGEQVVVVEPADKVIADDPNYPRVTSGVVRVTEAGTYTVTYNVEDERGVSEICSGQVVKTVEVACAEDHVGH